MDNKEILEIEYGRGGNNNLPDPLGEEDDNGN